MAEALRVDSDLFERVQSLYDANRFLDAYELTRPFWDDGQLADDLDADALVLGARLAGRLGGGRTASRLMRVAASRFPDRPHVRFYAFDVMHRFASLLEELRHYDAVPFEPTGDDAVDAMFLARRGSAWARIHDTVRSDVCFDRAFALAPDDYSIRCARSHARLEADDVGGALDDVDRAHQLHPGHPGVAQARVHVYGRAGRLEELVPEILKEAESGQSYEIAMLGAWLLGGRCARRSGGALPDDVRRMTDLAEALPQRAPLADRAARRLIARVRLDAAMTAGRFDDASRLADEALSRYHQRVLCAAGTEPAGERFVLDHRPVQQNFMTCLPSSVATVLSHFDVPFDQAAFENALTMGGTSVWSASDYLAEKAGVRTIDFRATPEAVAAVLRSRLPFVLHEQHDMSAHSMAAVGLDDRLGLVLIHDPGSFRIVETILDRIAEREGPIGPFGTVLLPEGAPAPELPEGCVADGEAYVRFHGLLESEGVRPADAFVEAFERTRPGSPIAIYLRARLHAIGRRTEAALSLIEDLRARHPDCIYLQREIVAIWHQLQNWSSLKRELERLIANPAAADKSAEAAPRRVHPIYYSRYADILRMMADARPQAYRMAKAALRRLPFAAEPYHLLADIYLADGRHNEARLPLWAACCLNPSDDHTARAYADLLSVDGRMDEAVRFMADRAERLGRHPMGASAWMAHIDYLEDAGFPDRALDEADRMAALHSENALALEFAVRFFARVGEWGRADDAMRRLGGLPNRTHRLSAATMLHWVRGDWRSALDAAESWIEQDPGNIDARRMLLMLLENRDGAEACLTRARQWLDEHPEQAEYESLVNERLQMVGRDDERLALMRRRVGREPHDAWAWRELAFIAFALHPGKDAAEGEEHLATMREAIAQLERISPDAGLCGVRAALAEAEGRIDDALGHLLDAIADKPDYLFAIRRAWDLTHGSDPETRDAVYALIREALFRGESPPDASLVFMVADRYGFQEAWRLMEALAARYPNSPHLVEAQADLYLRFAVGQRADDLPCGLPALVERLETAHRDYPFHRGIALSLVQALQRDGRNDRAGELLDDLVRRAPLDLDARAALAEHLTRTGRDDEALACIEAAVTYNPGNGRAWHVVAQALADRGDVDGAVATYARGLEHLPHEVGLREVAVDFLFILGDDEGAVALARRGAEVFPDGAYMWHLYARALNRAQGVRDTSSPIELLRRALQLNPRLYDAADELAQSLVARGRFDEAEAAVAPFFDDSESGVYARGRSYAIRFDRGEADEAIRGMGELLTQNPDFPWGWRVLLAWTQDRPDRGEILQRYFKTYPDCLADDVDFRIRRLELIEEAGRNLDVFETVEAEWWELLDYFPDHAMAHIRMIERLMDARRLSDARTVLDRIEPRQPNTPGVIVAGVKLCTLENDKAAALAAFDRFMGCRFEEAATQFDAYVFNTLVDAQWAIDALFAILNRMAAGHWVRLGCVWMAAGRLARPDSIADKSIRRALRGLQATARQHPRKVPIRWLGWLLTLGNYNSQNPKVKRVSKELLKFAAAVDRLPWTDARHTAMILGVANDVDPHIAVNYFHMAPSHCRENACLWGEVGRALSQTSPARAVRLFAQWREMPGVQMWMMGNYAICHRSGYPRKARRRRDEIDAVLQSLPHDHTAWFLVRLLLECHLRMDDPRGFIDAFDRYAPYAERVPTEDEYQDEQWLVQGMLLFQRLLTATSPEELDRRHAEFDTLRRQTRVPRFAVRRWKQWVRRRRKELR